MTTTELDLAGLHAGDVVLVERAYYDVMRFEVAETLLGHDHAGRPMVETVVRLSLRRPRRGDRFVYEPDVPPGAVAIEDIRTHKTTINGRSWWLSDVKITSRGYELAAHAPPEYIDLELRPVYTSEAQQS